MVHPSRQVSCGHHGLHSHRPPRARTAPRVPFEQTLSWNCTGKLKSGTKAGFQLAFATLATCLCAQPIQPFCSPGVKKVLMIWSQVFDISRFLKMKLKNNVLTTIKCV